MNLPSDKLSLVWVDYEKYKVINEGTAYSSKRYYGVEEKFPVYLSNNDLFGTPSIIIDTPVKIIINRYQENLDISFEHVKKLQWGRCCILGRNQSYLAYRKNKKKIIDFMKEVYITEEMSSLLKINVIRFSEIRTSVINNFHCLKDSLVNEVIRDGQENILMFCLAYAKKPTQIKKEIGKGAWKKLINNTEKENRVLYKLITGKFCLDMQNIKKALEIPMQRFAKCIGFTGVDRIQSNMQNIAFVNNHYEKLFHKDYKGFNYSWVHLTKKGQDIRSLLFDCMHMSRKVAFDVYLNPKWSLRKFKKYHDDLTLLYNMRTQGEFANFKNFKLSRAVNYLFRDQVRDSFIALETGMDYLEESRVMHHCISIHARSANDNRYIAFKIEDEGERFTLGIFYSKNQPEPFKFDQVKLRWNGDPSQSVKEKCVDLVSILNKNSKKIQNIMDERCFKNPMFGQRFDLKKLEEAENRIRELSNERNV